MQKITPFLWFDHQAEEAVKFYTSIFKNSKTGRILRYSEEAKASGQPDRKSTRLNSSHLVISYAVFCLKKKKQMRDAVVVIEAAVRVPIGAEQPLPQVVVDVAADEQIEPAVVVVIEPRVARRPSVHLNV